VDSNPPSCSALFVGCIILVRLIWLASHLFAGPIYAKEKATLSRRRYKRLRTFSVIIAGVGFSVLAAPKTFGQTIAPSSMAAASLTPSVAPAEVERVIVTGSNIPTAAEVGPNPVDILNREQVDKAGERTTAKLVRNLTVAGPNGVPSSNNGAGLTPGASSIALRGFDASSTLVLIDGHRVAPYPLGTGTDIGAVTFVDQACGRCPIFATGVGRSNPSKRSEKLLALWLVGWIEIDRSTLIVTRRAVMPDQHDGSCFKFLGHPPTRDWLWFCHARCQASA
jgi:TonB-dependent Receptor Plug Domain